MAIVSSNFGTTKDGRPATLYTISNRKGMKAVVSDLGALLIKLLVPDAKGAVRDVVQGFDTLEEYEINPNFFGATIGPNANRIDNASFTIDGETYELDANDGTNNLHSHRQEGYHKRMWAAECTDNSVTFTLEDQDGSMGFPGNKKFVVTYTLGEDNDLKIQYHAASDKKTVINPTNHTYFNLMGQGSGDNSEHELWLKASHYTPVNAKLIPTGEIAAVAGTPMDFTQPKKIGLEIDADFEQLNLAGGYDHNWVLDGWDGSLKHFATVKSPDGALTMKVSTTLPGVQFYAGNFLDGQPGKGGAAYQKRYALCLETQYYPNSANEPSFPSCIFGDGREYDSVTIYSFE